jgi:hypothetical protein
VTTKHDDQLVEDLVALVEHDPTLASQMLRILSDHGVASADLVRSEQARIALAHGDKIALIQHGESGETVTPKQGVALLVEGLSGASVSNEVLQRATTAALPVLAKEHGKLISALRASQDRATSVSTLERMGLAAQAAPTAAQDAIVSLGIELIGKIASTAGEQTTRKNWTLRTMRACIALQPTAIGRLVEAALAREVIYTYDLVHDQAISQLAVADEVSLRQLVNRAESSADLTAASSLVGRVKDEKLQGQYLRLLLKQFGDQRTPSAEAATSVLPGLDALVRLHEAAPEKPAASHDEAVLRRWASLQPAHATTLIAAAEKIGAARAPHTERFKQERVVSARLGIAKQYVKESIVANHKLVILVGGTYSHDVVAAFNELHPADPVWGDWIFKERSQPIKSGEVDEAIASLRCVGVVIVAKPAGHTIVNQAKDAVKRHGKPHVTIHNSSKNALRNGLVELLLNLHMANADTSAE